LFLGEETAFFTKRKVLGRPLKGDDQTHEFAPDSLYFTREHRMVASSNGGFLR
jgi:hypothetical protein